MLQYKVGEDLFAFSYKATKEHYERVCEMSDSEFMSALPEIIHLACFICYVKELHTQDILGDRGIIHQLAHLLHIPADENIKEIRKQFNETLKLS